MTEMAIEAVDLSRSPEILRDMLEGQLLALKELGVGDGILSEEDLVPRAGMYASVVRSPSGDVVGGARVYTRAGGHPLPLECDDSPLSAEQRALLTREDELCEVKGLWIAKNASGRFLSRRVIAHGSLLGYSLGCKAVVGMAHARAFQFISGPLGYLQDARIPAFPYPDERFMSIIAWHREGPQAIRDYEEKLLVRKERPMRVAL